MKNKQLESYYNAKKRVDLIKSFYGHLFWYVFVNAAIFIVNQIYQDEYYKGNWFFINLLTTTLLWGIGVLVHGIQAFRPQLFSKITKRSVFNENWEERKLRELLKEEEINHSKKNSNGYE